MAELELGGITPFFVHHLSLRWRDMDSYAHVNNSVYLTLCEETRIAWFNSIPGGPWRTATCEPVGARIEMDYRKSLMHPASVWVQLSLERIGKSSLTLQQYLGVLGSSTVFAQGKTVLVWVNPTTGKATPVPDAVQASARQALSISLESVDA